VLLFGPRSLIETSAEPAYVKVFAGQRLISFKMSLCSVPHIDETKV